MLDVVCKVKSENFALKYSFALCDKLWFVIWLFDEANSVAKLFECVKRKNLQMQVWECIQ